MKRDGDSYETLQRLRALYEGYATALSDYLSMPLPPWISDKPHKDSWQTVARLGTQNEPDNSQSVQGTPFDEKPQSIAAITDDRHDF